jgi:hypothetical protein
MKTNDAAFDYISTLGVEPTRDSIEQLAGPFAEALRIMCTRGYDPEGRTWKIRGWKGLVHSVLDKAERIKFHSWDNDRFHEDSAIDIINFAGFYWRLKNKGKKWGEWGKPS